MQIRRFNCFGYQKRYKGTQGVCSSAGTQNKPIFFRLITMNEDMHY